MRKDKVKRKRAQAGIYTMKAIMYPHIKCSTLALVLNLQNDMNNKKNMLELLEWPILILPYNSICLISRNQYLQLFTFLITKF